MPFDVSFCVLSWKACATLRHTLTSFQRENILPDFRERLLFFNEISDEDVAIAREFDFDAIGSPTNIGIFGAVEGLAGHAQSPYMLVIENDCPLDVPGAKFRSLLKSAIDDMELMDVPVFLMRSRISPGEPFGRRTRYEDHFKVIQPLGSDVKNPTPSMLRRLFEDWRHATKRGCAIYAEEVPSARHPGIIEQSPNGNWITTSEHLSWSNCCYLVRRNFLREVVLARVRSHPSPSNLNGHQDIEAAMKHKRWWRKQKVRMGQSEPGPFTHIRLDR